MKPYRIDVFEDFLYVALNQKSNIIKVNKFGAENITILEIGSSRVTDLAIFQENKQIPRGKLRHFIFRNISSGHLFLFVSFRN